MSGSDMRGLSPSTAGISSSEANEASGAELSIEEVIDGDFDRVSSHYAAYEVRLRFLLFGPSMPAYLPA
jgi:hypothetical protein